MRRRTGLTALFWRYLLVTGGAVVLLAVLWWGGLSALLRSGFVLPAGTAAGQADGLVRALEAGELTPAELPHYYRWAAFDGSAQVVGQRGMDERHLGYARAALGATAPSTASPYQQYHRSAQLPDGTVCLLQFDYSMPYGSPRARGGSRSFRPAPRRCCWRAGWPPGPSPPGTSPACSGGTPPLLTAATGAIAARRLDVPPWTGAPGCGSWGRAWPPWSSSGRPWPGLCPSSGPWSRSAPRRWPPWPTTSRPPCPSSAAARSCWRRTPSPPPSGSAWTPFSAAPDASGTIWSSSAPSPPPGARRRWAAGRRRNCPRWRRAGRPLGAACAPPGGCAFLWTAPASRPCTLFRSE